MLILGSRLSSTSLFEVSAWKPAWHELTVFKDVGHRDVTTPVLFFSRPRSEGWPHHGRTFSIYLCPLSFWLTLPRRILSTSWCCPSRPCVVFLACVHLAFSAVMPRSPALCLTWYGIPSLRRHIYYRPILLSVMHVQRRFSGETRALKSAKVRDTMSCNRQKSQLIYWQQWRSQKFSMERVRV